MEDKLIMSKKELERKTLLEHVKCGKLYLKEAADRLGIGYRQIKRIWKSYKEKGDKGLSHKNRGQRPKNAYSRAFKSKVLDLYQTKYFEFGPTFAAEKMLEDDRIAIHHETLRLWLKEAGLWTRKRKRKVYRERRERRPCFGDLLQIDGSIHQWLPADKTYYCLLNMVDDATGISLGLLDKGETTKVLLTTFKKWIEKYGIPKAVYVDLKSVYVSPKPLKEKYDDDLLVQEGFSNFEQVCKKLNIQIIRAYSAQAKGRVERKHAVYQDRFVKELRLYKRKTLEEANAHLDKFVVKINNKFAKSLEAVSDSHRSANEYDDLDQIICSQYKRQLRNDWTIQFKREYYQIETGFDKILQPGEFIMIKKHVDDRITFWHGDTKLTYKNLTKKPIPPSRSKKYYKAKGGYDRLEMGKRSRRNKHKTPWSQHNPNWLKNHTTTSHKKSVALAFITKKDTLSDSS